MSQALPDVNVWLALTHEGHRHSVSAMRWLGTTAAGRIWFCRVTQMGLLRLLSTEAIMADECMSQARAWAAYDAWQKRDDRVCFAEEPQILEAIFRGLSRGRQQTAPGHWVDAYLIAFAQLIGATLVTFDRRLAERARPEALLLD